MNKISLCTLPGLVIFKILNLIDSPFDLISLANTCRQMHHLIYDHCERLWTKLAFDWCDGLWPYLPKLKLNNDLASDWFKSLLKILADVKPPTADKFILANDKDKTIWRRCESWQFRCYMSMWKLTFSEHHHKHLSHPAVLDYSFIYDMAFYQPENNQASFNDLMLCSDFNAQSLGELGKAAKYDPRNRKRNFVHYPSYIKLINKSSSFDGLFNEKSGDEITHGSPPLPCAYIQPSSSSEELLLATIMCLNRLLAERLRPLCLKNELSLSSVASFISDVCNVFCLMHSLLWNDRQSDGHKIVLNSIIDVELLYNDDVFQDIARFRFGALQKEIYNKYSGIPIMFDLSIIASEVLNVISSTDMAKQIKELRQKWLGPVLSRITKFIEGRGDINQVNLTDSALCGGDNTHQQMVCVSYINKKAMMVVWQLIGPPRY